MSSYDPRQLIIIIEDLLDCLQIWSSVARDTLDEADWVQRTTREYVDRASHRAAIVKSQAQKDEQLVSAKKSRYDSVAAKCVEAATETKETLAESQKALDDANQTYTRWELELAEAIAWLERAMKRLETAEKECERAKKAVQRAEEEADKASRRYNSCLRDGDKSCKSEKRAYENAQADLVQALERLKRAIRELEAAGLEVQRAQARVSNCQRAVELAEQAVGDAQHNLDIARQAEKMAAISLEFSGIVQQLAKQAETAAEQETSTAESLLSIVREASKLTDEAQLYLSSASDLEDSAQGYVSSLNLELTSRIGSLIALNQPVSELEAGAIVKGIVSGSPPRLSSRLAHLPHVATATDVASQEELEQAFKILSPVLPYYLSSIIGKASCEIGKVGEQIGTKILEDVMDLRVVEVTNAQGVDIKAQDKVGSLVAVEVKTSMQDKNFSQLLGKGYGHKQCSNGWLKAVGVNPNQVTVLGIHINPQSETFTIYQRMDNKAKDWNSIMSDVPLSQFLER